MLTDKQKQEILNALRSGGKLAIKPTKTQSGGLLGTILASIGIPLAIEAFKKMTGKGAPRIGREGGRAPRMGMYPYQPPPFFDQWGRNTVGMGTEKKGKGLLLGKNSPL